MPWMRGSIELEDGSTYSGEFMVRDDRQLDEVFRPDINEQYLYFEDEDLVSGKINGRSIYQVPD